MKKIDKPSLGFALCGSYCTHATAVQTLEKLAPHYNITPIVSLEVANTDTRFGKAHDLMQELQRICDHPVLHSISSVEPIGPKQLLDLLIIAPCTGNTLGKLAHGIADTPVTLAAKAHLRNGKPILIAPSTNDGLAVSAANIGQLLGRKHIFFVPFQQDDPIEKPDSLISDFSLLPEATSNALQHQQLQPILCQSKAD